MEGIKTYQKGLIKIYDNVYCCKSFLLLHNFRNILIMIDDSYSFEEIEEETKHLFGDIIPKHEITRNNESKLKYLLYNILNNCYRYKENKKIIKKYFVSSWLEDIEDMTEKGLKMWECDDITDEKSYDSILFDVIERIEMPIMYKCSD